ncbi:hypothetical protein [Streptomyces pseudogriseolus]|uniref:hypothetical protein n=1 Tax=Streptomyces pseudogriseolus TaxID=36817 RepID=UPI003FA2ABAE
MATEQLPDRVREFTDHLRGLLARLDRYTGWCPVFWQRDPDGMRACVEGREPPPWDVVESLLQDLAAVHGPAAAEAELPRARLLHAEATAAFDARPGARQALRDRLDVMLREQRYAADRRADLTHRLASATGQEDADALAADLAWAEDDHRRATARRAELTARVTALDAATQGAGSPHPRGRPRLTADTSTPAGPQSPHTPPAAQGHDPSPSPAHRHAGAGPHPAREGRGPGPAPGAPQPGPGPDAASGVPGPETPGPAPGAPQSGPGPDAATGVPGPETPGATALHHLAAVPEPHPSAPLSSSSPQPHPLAPDPIPPELRAAQQHVPAPPPATAPSPSPAENTRPAPTRKRRRGGARFAGVEDDGAQPLVAPPAAVPELPAVTAARGARFAGAAEQDGPAEPPPRERIGADDVREVGRLVHTLTRLRREARSGEAHALLNRAAYWPAVRFPPLADAMERAGLAADWATLLWEAAATLPAERLVAAADALTAGGRAEDGEQILRQGVVRPADEIGHAALALADGTRHRELRALVDACVRTRTPQDAARTAAPDPGRLVPLLLTAARAVSEERHWDVLHALRVAGLAA